MVISQFGGTWSFLNLVEDGHFSILWNMVVSTRFLIFWNMVISQFNGRWSFLNLVEHGHFSIWSNSHFSIWWNVVISLCFLIWNMVISKFDETRSFLNLLYLGLSLGFELKGFDLCQFIGTWSFLNLMEHGHFSICCI